MSSSPSLIKHIAGTLIRGVAIYTISLLALNVLLVAAYFGYIERACADTGGQGNFVYLLVFYHTVTMTAAIVAAVAVMSIGRNWFTDRLVAMTILSAFAVWAALSKDSLNCALALTTGFVVGGISTAKRLMMSVVALGAAAIVVFAAGYLVAVVNGAGPGHCAMSHTLIIPLRSLQHTG